MALKFIHRLLPRPAEIDAAKIALSQHAPEEAYQLLLPFLLRRFPHADTLHIAGVALVQTGQLDEGEKLLQIALEITKTADIYCDLGNIAKLRGDLERAEIHYRVALAQQQHHFAALRGLMSTLSRQGQTQEVLELGRSLPPTLLTDTTIQRLYGQAAANECAYEEAYPLLWEALEQLPDDIELICYTAMSALMSRRPELAEQILNRALAQTPDSDYLLFHKSFALLMQGRWPEGFSLYEHRYGAWKAGQQTEFGKAWHALIDKATASLQVWQGENLADKTIAIWGEQGFGDMIMCLRFLKQLKTQAPCKIIFLCTIPIKPLQAAFPFAEFVIPHEGLSFSSQEVDYHCSIFSLPHLLKASLESIDKHPYITPPQEILAHWSEKVSRMAPNEKLKIGISWAGNSKMPLDKIRSTTLETLSPILKRPDIAFFSLQKDEDSFAEIENSGMPIINIMSEAESFLDTAGIICHMDLVIAIDSSVAHLAGATGKETWLLNRYESEWRWLLNRTDSVWYTNMRIFTQATPNNWRELISRVDGALCEKLIARNQPHSTSPRN